MQRRKFNTLTISLACIVFGMALGASLFSVVWHDPAKWIGVDKRADWLGFWGAIIGALATIGAGATAWLAVDRQIEAARKAQREIEDRALDNVSLYLEQARSVFPIHTNIADQSLPVKDYNMFMKGFAYSLYFAMRPDFIISSLPFLPATVADYLLNCIRRHQEVLENVPTLRLQSSHAELMEFAARIASIHKDGLWQLMAEGNRWVTATEEKMAELLAERGHAPASRSAKE